MAIGKTARNAVIAIVTILSLMAWPAWAAPGQLKLESSGSERSALRVIRDPLKLNKRPLVIVLHDSNSRAARVRNRLGLEEFAHSKGAIFIYPNAVDGRWSDAASVAENRDLTFLRNLTTRVLRDGRVDPKRIFLIGVGSGGALALRAACAGIGFPIVGLGMIRTTIPPELVQGCKLPQAMAYVDVISGFGSQAQPSGDGKTTNDARTGMELAEATAELFAKKGECAREKVSARIVLRSGSAVAGATVERFSGCKAPVELISLGEGTEKTARQSDADRTIDAGKAVWEFLARAGA